MAAMIDEVKELESLILLISGVGSYQHEDQVIYIVGRIKRSQLIFVCSFFKFCGSWCIIDNTLETLI